MFGVSYTQRDIDLSPGVSLLLVVAYYQTYLRFTMDFKVAGEIKLAEEIFDARYHSSKDNLICVATIAGNILLVEDGKLTSKLKKHHKGSPIRRVRFGQDGRMITIAKTVKIYDLDTNQNVLTLKRDDQEKDTFYSVMPLGNNLVTAGDDGGKLFVWDTRTPEKMVFSSSDCDQYISDIDGRYEGRKIVCTSGEGTLTAYDLRANKMIDPQSELFEAGFQCVKLVDFNKKVVIGGEDGAIYVFNQNEWAHTSGKFPISDDTQNRGKCSIENIDVLPDSSIFLTACSDGRMRSLTLWPHQVLSETILCKRNSLDTLHVNPHSNKSEIVVGGDKFLNLVSYEEKSDDEDEDEDGSKTSKTNSLTDDDSDDSNISEPQQQKSQQQAREQDENSSTNDTKKLKVATEDYLNIFK